MRAKTVAGGALMRVARSTRNVSGRVAATPSSATSSTTMVMAIVLSMTPPVIYAGGPSRTGRTSTVPTRATAPRAAMSIASSRFATSMSM